MQTAEMTTEQKWEHYQEQGWRYIPDPKTWTGGIWIHDEYGTVNNCGGSFPTITRAVEAMEQWQANWARIA